MRKLLAAVAVVALLGPALAHAQPDGRGDRGNRGPRGRDGGQFQAPQNPQAQTQPQAPAVQAGPPRGERAQRFQSDRGQGRGQAASGDRGGFRGRGDRNAQAPQAPQAQQQQPQGQRFDRGQARQGFGGNARTERRFDTRRDDDRRGAVNNRAPNSRAYDSRGFARGGSYSYRGRSFDRFRAQPYRWPGGYRGAFSWRAHQFLPTSFLIRDYYIDNYWEFGFGPPPYGYEWVRVGDDALLVDVYTGEIADVALGVFYW